jgi:amino acid transporter
VLLFEDQTKQRIQFMVTPPAQFEHSALGLRDVVFQGISHIGPALSVVFILPLIAGRAGAAMPISLALAVVVCFFVANTVAQFSRYMPSSGGYYTFVSRGLGPRSGFLTTWSYLIYDILGPAGAVGYLGDAVADFLQEGANISVPWWLFSLATAALVWALTYFGIRISTHATALLSCVEMLIIFALGVTCLVDPGEGSSLTAPLDPSAAPGGWTGILSGMLFSILALTGFEAPAPLAEETRRPNRFIYQAIFTSLAIVGLFYVFMAYASAIGWGTGNMSAFAADDAYPYKVLARKLWGPGRWLVFFALLNGALAVAISCTNAATRVMYTMALAGTLPAALQRIHPIHKTPYWAVHVHQLLLIGSFLLIGVVFGASNIFEFLGTLTGLAAIALYIPANIALTVFVRREHPADFNAWLHGVVPIIGSLFLLPVIVVNVLAVTDYPFNLTPFLFVGLMLLGFVVMKIIEMRRPEALARPILVQQRLEEMKNRGERI